MESRKQKRKRVWVPSLLPLSAIYFIFAKMSVKEPLPQQQSISYKEREGKRERKKKERKKARGKEGKKKREIEKVRMRERERKKITEKARKRDREKE